MKYWRKEDFSCPCGRCDLGFESMSTWFTGLLQGIAEMTGVVPVLASTIRCSTHNQAVGGSPNSAHLRGLAADILTPDNNYRYRLIDACRELHICRIGIYKGHTHIDVAGNLPQNNIWCG